MEVPHARPHCFARHHRVDRWRARSTLVPGPDPIGILGTILLGIVGSFVGGFLGYALFHKDSQEGFLQPSGIIGSVIGAVIALLIYRAVSGRSRARI